MPFIPPQKPGPATRMPNNHGLGSSRLCIQRATATDRQPPPTANHQPLPTAANCQPPTLTNHQLPTTDRRRPPPTVPRMFIRIGQIFWWGMGRWGAGLSVTHRQMESDKWEWHVGRVTYFGTDAGKWGAEGAGNFYFGLPKG